MSETCERPNCLLIADNFPPTVGGVSAYYRGLSDAYGPRMKVVSPYSTDGLPRLSTSFGHLRQAVKARRLAASSCAPWVLYGHPHLLSASHWVPKRKALFIHGGEWQDRRILGVLLSRIEADCDLIVANSHATVDRWIERRYRSRTRILHPGISEAWIAQGQRAAARRSLVPQTWRLLTVARLVPRKGVVEVAQMIEAMAASGVPIELTVVGAGPELPNLQTLFERSRAVRFLGALDTTELGLAYERADAFIMCPDQRQGGEGFEGFGIVYLEAAAYGLPVLATATGGTVEAVTAEGARLAPAGNWDLIQANVEWLIDRSPDELAHIRDENLRWAATCSWTLRAGDLAAMLAEA